MLEGDSTLFRSDYSLLILTLQVIGTFVYNVAASATANNLRTLEALLAKKTATRADIESLREALQEITISVTLRERRSELKQAIARQLPDLFHRDNKERITNDIVDVILDVLDQK